MKETMFTTEKRIGKLKEIAKALGVKGYSKYTLSTIEELRRLCSEAEEKRPVRPERPLVPWDAIRERLLEWHPGQPRWKIPQWALPRIEFQDNRELNAIDHLVDKFVSLPLPDGKDTMYQPMLDNPLILEKVIDLLPKWYIDQHAEDINLNPGAVNFLLKYPQYVRWTSVERNPAAAPILRRRTGVSLESIMFCNDHLYLTDAFCEGMKTGDDYYAEALASNPIGGIIAQEYVHIEPEARELFMNENEDIEYSIGRAFWNPSFRWLILEEMKNLSEDPEKKEHLWEAIFSNPAMIDFIEEKIAEGGDDIPWDCLLSNPGAVEIIKRNLHHFSDHEVLNFVPYELDLQRMKKDMLSSGFKKELMEKVYNPNRLERAMELEAERLKALGLPFEIIDPESVI